MAVGVSYVTLNVLLGKNASSTTGLLKGTREDIIVYIYRGDRDREGWKIS